MGKSSSNKRAGGQNIDQCKSEIVAALLHPEADEGLFLRNFNHLHEEDERPAVLADDRSVCDALSLLIKEGKVKVEERYGEPIFSLAG